jgi:hypothetical protein
MSVTSWLLAFTSAALQYILVSLVYKNGKAWRPMQVYALGIFLWSITAMLCYALCGQAPYFYTYWIGRAIVIVLHLSLVLAFGRALLRHLNWVSVRAVWHYGIVAAVAGCLAWAVIGGQPVNYHDPISQFVFAAERGAAALEATLFVFVLLPFAIFPRGISKVLGSVGLGLSFQLATQIILSSLYAYLPYKHLSLLSDLAEARDLLVLAFWIFAFRKEAIDPVPPVLSRKVLGKLTDAADSLKATLQATHSRRRS